MCVALLTSRAALAQFDDAFTVVPPIPSASAPFTIQIHALTGTPASPGIVPSRTTVVGSTIRIEGCEPKYGFDTPSQYWVVAPIGPLAAATYGVEYYSSYYCLPNPADAAEPPRLYLTEQVVVAPASAPDATYTIRDLGAFNAVAINASGQVAGNIPNDGRNIHAVLYSAGTLTDLSAIDGGPTDATAINDKGEIVGGRGPFLRSALLYSDGRIIDFSAVCGAFDSWPTGINANTDIVGFCEDPSVPYARHSFLYTAGHSVHLSLGERFSEANAINSSGQLVGERSTDLTGPYPQEAFLYGAGAVTDLGTLADSTSSYAYAINADGKIVGQSGAHAFLYSGGVMLDLGTVAAYDGGLYYSANAINASGQIVGSAAILDSFPEPPPALPWVYVDGTMRDPNTLVDSTGGWKIMEVVGINDAGQIAANGSSQGSYHALMLSPASFPNYQGLWWNAPAESESGWGVSFAHQGDVIFATWFTYDVGGKGLWFSMTAYRMGGTSFAGTLYQTTGPAFDVVPFDSSQVVPKAVGTGTLSFSDENTGTFSYAIANISQTKTITREVFGTLPACTFNALNDLSIATNYQDLWWNSPAGSESGWGISLAHESDTIFGTWFTYDHDHSPMWLAVTANKTSTGTYSGDLLRTSGTPYYVVPFDPASVQRTKVGTATLSFVDGNEASFAYTVNGISQTKVITRQVFRAPGTICR